MSITRRLWNLAKALLRPRKPLGATDPEPPSVDDLRAEIRVGLVISEALADVAGWRVEDTIMGFTISNGGVRFTWDKYGGPMLAGAWELPTVNGHMVSYKVSKRALRRARDAAFDYAENERRRLAAQSVAR